MLLEQERKDVVTYCRLMQTRQLTKGTGGNISIYNRELGLVAISPSGVEYATMQPEDVVVTDIHGKIIEGDLIPSSELGMHTSIYEHREDLSAVVHTHSTYATVIACANLPLPAVHYMIGYSGVHEVPCIPYFPFGTVELANAAGEKYGEIPELTALLLGNHGLITAGPNINFAFNAAEEIEFTCELYYHQLAMGTPLHLLSKEQMDLVQSKFKTYGQKK